MKRSRRWPPRRSAMIAPNLPTQPIPGVPDYYLADETLEEAARILWDGGLDSEPPADPAVTVRALVDEVAAGSGFQAAIAGALLADAVYCLRWTRGEEFLDALDWVAAREGEAGGFSWCCGLLRWDPAVIEGWCVRIARERAILRRAAEERNGQLTLGW